MTTNNYLIHKPKKSIILPFNQEVLDNIPRSKEFSYKGKQLVQVAHGELETNALSKMGINVPSPISVYYDWPLVRGRFDPFHHQIKTAEAFTLHHKIVCLNSMGMGKTESALYAADYFLKNKKIKKVLILAPLSCLNKVWGDAIFHSFHWHSYTIVHGTKPKRLKNLETDVSFYIANHEFLRMCINKVENNRGTYDYTFNNEFSEMLKFDAIIVDEYSMYRNSQTYLFKALQCLLKKLNPKYFWPLTGTPCPSAPTDAWALTRLINPEGIDKYFGSFRNKVMVNVGHGQYAKWIPKQGSHEFVYDVLQPAVRFNKKDCLDLPPLTYQNRECEMSADQKKHIKSMLREMVMKDDSAEISAVNAADRLIKLRQIMLGVIKNGEEYVPIDFKPRFKLLLELIEEADNKVIVVVPYKGILRFLKKEMSKHYSCDIVNGDVSKSDRDAIFTKFQDTKDPHVLLCHPRVMSHGLTLTRANYLIFYGPIDSNDYHEQASERINRPGQTNNMSIVYMGGHSIEWGIYEGLQQKKSFQKMALELYHKEIA